MQSQNEIAPSITALREELNLLFAKVDQLSMSVRSLAMQYQSLGVSLEQFKLIAASNQAELDTIVGMAATGSNIGLVQFLGSLQSTYGS